MEELWRCAAIADVLVLFTCGYYLHVVYGPRLPSVLTHANYAFAAVLVLVVASVVANLLSGTPPTIGVKIFAIGSGMAAATVAYLTSQVVRGQR